MFMLLKRLAVLTWSLIWNKLILFGVPSTAKVPKKCNIFRDNVSSSFYSFPPYNIRCEILKLQIVFVRCTMCGMILVYDVLSSMIDASNILSFFNISVLIRCFWHHVSFKISLKCTHFGLSDGLTLQYDFWLFFTLNLNLIYQGPYLNEVIYHYSPSDSWLYIYICKLWFKFFLHYKLLLIFI